MGFKTNTIIILAPFGAYLHRSNYNTGIIIDITQAELAMLEKNIMSHLTRAHSSDDEVFQQGEVIALFILQVLSLLCRT